MAVVLNSSIVKPAILFRLLLACTIAVGCRRAKHTQTAEQKTPADAAFPAKLPKGAVQFIVPRFSDITDTSVQRSVIRGHAILEATEDSLPHNVGNSLRCTSCHFAGGTVPNAMPWVGVYGRYPQYRPRSGQVDLIENRINDCFERSMNGRPLAPDSPEMRDIVAYLAFLSYGIKGGSQVSGQGLPKLANLSGDTTRGSALFGMKCARCHGPSGGGSALAPPLWGEKSYNIGAGMARRSVLAAFIHTLMPFDSAGTLSAQQSYDIAAYVNTRPRPDFPGKENDWPLGGAPSDVAYAVKSSGASGRQTH